MSFHPDDLPPGSLPPDDRPPPHLPHLPDLEALLGPNAPAWAAADVLRAPDGRPIGVLAPVTVRVLAQAIRAIAWLLVQMLLITLLTLASGDGGPSEIAQVLVGLAPVAVDAWCVGAFGWDPGKLALRLRAVGPDGQLPGLWAATVRTLVVQAPIFLVWVPGLVGVAAAVVAVPWVLALVVTMVTGREKQGWQDRVAGTHVIARPDSFGQTHRGA